MTFAQKAQFALVFASSLFVLSSAPALAQDQWTVEVEAILDQKAVYATVESVDVIAARARIAGTIVSLDVDEGDRVEAGAVLAVVVDDRMAPQVRALNAQVTAFMAEERQARSEYDRVQQLFDRGVVAQARLDEARTRVDVVQGQLDAKRQERGVLLQQQREGEILAPANGIVLEVGVTAGAVVFAGEPIGRIAAENFILRLRLPERHARYLELGASIRVDQSALGSSVAETGVIQKVYPQISDGRVLADVEVAGLGEFFVGERVRVWVPAGERNVILIPEELVHSRFGIDFVTLRTDADRTLDVVVQRGRASEGARVEILSGLAEGDVVVMP